MRGDYADNYTLCYMGILVFKQDWYMAEAWQWFNGYILRHLHIYVKKCGIDRKGEHIHMGI